MIKYFFIWSILKPPLNTDTLVENGTSTSNTVAVSSRQCSI